MIKERCSFNVEYNYEHSGGVRQLPVVSIELPSTGDPGWDKWIKIKMHVPTDKIAEWIRQTVIDAKNEAIRRGEMAENKAP